jgi:hypothetical protein
MDSEVMSNAAWEEIHGFATPGEFERFKTWIATALEEAAIIEVPVLEQYGGSPLFDECWYREPDGSTWRLVAPNPPFRGVFERVPRR